MYLLTTSPPLSRLFSYYPMPATVIIFCNILQNPLHPDAKSAAELLRAVPVLLGIMCSRGSGMTDIIDMDVVGRFLAELVRLAECAIEKARRGLVGSTGHLRAGIQNGEGLVHEAQAARTE